MNCRLTAAALDFYVDVSLRDFGGRWLAVADIAGEQEVGLGRSARAALGACLLSLGRTAAESLLADAAVLKFNPGLSRPPAHREADADVRSGPTRRAHLAHTDKNSIRMRRDMTEADNRPHTSAAQQEEMLRGEIESAFGGSDPQELLGTDSARLAHLRMVVRGTLKAMAEEKWQLALDYLVEGFEREEHARRRQAGEDLEPFWLLKMRRSSSAYHAENDQFDND